jgi:pimeloyl-ACP methyl ester carboxylesterase
LNARTPSHTTLRLLLAAFAGIAAVVVVAAPAFASGKQGPVGGAFYKPPKSMPKGHGKLIWQRPATKLTPIDGAKLNKTVLYTSRSPQGKRVAVSGSVSVPKGRPPKGGWPVISWAHGTTGIADVCAPTRIRPNSPDAAYVAYVKPQLEDWIDAGYAVVATDYQGLGTPGDHPYLIGKAEGRSVVDIVSAARQLVPSIGKRFLIAGHSQGGQSSLFAAALADDWAPKLKLRGTVAYAPASHIKEQAALLPGLTSPSGLSALAALIVRGASTTSKGVVKLLTPQAKALYPETRQVCLQRLAEPDSFGGLAPADLLNKNADLTDFDDILGGMNPAVKTRAPVLLTQGSSDATVFPFFTDLLNGELEKRGDDVTYKTYPGVNHGGIVAAAEDDALAFFEKRLPPK